MIFRKGRELRILVNRAQRLIKHEVILHYQKNVGISVQFPFLGQDWCERPNPGHSKCQRAIFSKGLKSSCDESDKIMGYVLHSYAKKHRALKSILYTCHQGLSNILVPCFLDGQKLVFWYLFLGQFELHNGIDNPDFKKHLEEASIAILEPAEITDNDRDFIKPGISIVTTGKSTGASNLHLTIKELIEVKQFATTLCNTFMSASIGQSNGMKYYIKNKMKEYYSKINKEIGIRNTELKRIDSEGRLVPISNYLSGGQNDKHSANG